MTDKMPIDEPLYLAEYIERMSVENRRHGLPRIAKLRGAKPAVAFLSVEPLLEDLGKFNLDDIDWVIVGGESGPGARPMSPDWVRSVRSQCEAQGGRILFQTMGRSA